MSKNRWRIRRWIRLGFLLWAVISTAWLADTMRTRGVDGDLMRSGKGVSVVDGDTTLEFVPAGPAPGAGLVFFCDSGVAAEAYAPLLRPVAEAGFAVCNVKLPFRFAPLETHKTGALSRARDAIGRHRDVAHWVFLELKIQF